MQNIVKVWLNQSAQIRSVLLNNNTQYYLHILADAVKQYPDVFFEVTSNITNRDPSSASRYYGDIHELLTGEHGVASPVVEQLDRIDAVVKMWLMQTSNLKLNIFVGFKDETSLVSYAFNNSGTRPQDSKIVAGTVGSFSLSVDRCGVFWCWCQSYSFYSVNQRLSGRDHRHMVFVLERFSSY